MNMSSWLTLHAYLKLRVGYGGVHTPPAAKNTLGVPPLKALKKTEMLHFHPYTRKKMAKTPPLPPLEMAGHTPPGEKVNLRYETHEIETDHLQYNQSLMMK